MTQKIPEQVQQVFESFPQKANERLQEIRTLIFERAAADEEIGDLTETLKWGEPAYLTEQSGSGSTVRLGYKEDQPDYVALYFNCQTTIIKDIKQRYADQFSCVGDRALLIPLNKPLPTKALAGSIDLALKYHLNKKARSAGLL